MLLSLGILIFVIVFYCIITEKVASAYATMLGALAMAFLGIVNEEQILETIHSRLEILLLLIGMMIIVSLISETGVFQWFAIKVVKIVRGDPLKLLILLSIVTATCSAFLDKDPTQLIIGSEGKLSFNEFLINTAPMTIIALVILLTVVYFTNIRKMQVPNRLRAQIMELESDRILTNKKLLKQSIIILTAVIIGFVLNNFVNKGLAVISLSGGILLAFLTEREPKKIFGAVEWDTLFFFIGLFVMIRGIENLGVIKFIGDKIIELSTGNFKVASISIMWLSSIFTSIFGNVANAATFSKIIKTVIPDFQTIADTKVFWWALSFGSCLGGSITMIGSATNVVAVSASAKAGCKIDFMKFFKFGSKIAILNLIAATVYMYLRYL